MNKTTQGGVVEVFILYTSLEISMSIYLRLPSVLGLAVALFAVGCAAPIGTNPKVTLTKAQVGDQAVELGLRVSNPSPRTLWLKGVKYEVTVGPLPIAQGQWQGKETLAPGAHTDLALTTKIQSPPLDPSETRVEVSGSLQLGEPGGDDMAFSNSAFHASSDDQPAAK